MSSTEGLQFFPSPPLHFLDSLVRSADFPIVGTDPHGLVVTWNPAAERLFGYSSQEILGEELICLMASHRVKEYALLSDRVRSGDSVEDVDLELVSKDGSPLLVNATISPIFTKDGVHEGSSIIARDVTKQRKMEQALVRHNRLESMGRMATSVIHDINNILTIVSACSQLIESEKNEVELQALRTAVQRGSALTRQLLCFARRPASDDQVVDTPALLAELELMLRRVLPESVSLTVESPSVLPNCTGDENELSQVLLNLALNASEAMPDGGALQVKARECVLDEEFCRTYPGLSSGRFVCLSFDDNGTGMDKDTLQRIFEPFFTTKAKGTGLGLAAAYGTVRRAGGAIRVHSEPNKGTTVDVFLPASADVAEEPAPISRGSRAPHQAYVLLVEDDDEVRAMTARLLRRADYIVTEANGPGEALLYCQQNQEPFELAVIDGVLPLMGGLELAQKLQKHRPSMRILFTSGYGGTQKKLNRLSAPYVCLEKPYDLNSLLRAVKDCLTLDKS